MRRDNQPKALFPPVSTTILLSITLSLLAGIGEAGVVTLQGPAPQVEFFQFQPLVIRSDRTDTVIFHAKVVNTPTRVVFELNTNPFPFQQPGIDMEMRDDGMQGDRRARDGIYAVMLPAAQITSGLQPDDVLRRFVGFLKVFQGTAQVARLNLFAEIITSEIPRLPVTRLAQDVEYTDYAVNILDPSFFSVNAQGLMFDATRTLKRFYQVFPDEFDSLNLIYVPSYPQNRVRVALKNDVQGIGQQLFNNTSFYGSAGRLLGFSIFPSSNFFDGAESGYQHELGHQWINYLSFSPLDSGRPHWPLSSLATGIMGWSDPVTKQGFDFPCQLVRESGGVRLVPRDGAPVFTDLDLYLMGLLPQDQVGDHLVFSDQRQAAMLPCNNQVYTGQMLTVRVADVVRATGRRTPDATSSLKRFNIGTILVSMDALLDEDALAFYGFFANRAEETREVPSHVGLLKNSAKPFAITTRGLGAIDSRIRRR